MYLLSTPNPCLGQYKVCIMEGSIEEDSFIAILFLGLCVYAFYWLEVALFCNSPPTLFDALLLDLYCLTSLLFHQNPQYLENSFIPHLDLHVLYYSSGQ